MGNLTLNGATSGQITISPPAVAGTNTLSLPASTGTIVAASGSGTSGQVLTSAGSGAVPTWTTPSSGAMTLISTQTVSGASTVSFTGLSGYDKYLLIYENATFTNNNEIFLSFGYGATPTYVTSGYWWSGIYGGRSAAQVNPASTFAGNTFSMIIGNYNNYGSGTSTSVYSGYVYLFNCSGTVPSAMSVSTLNDFTNNYMITQTLTGSVSVGNTVTALQIYMSLSNTTPTGNVTGKFSLYGISS